MRLWASLQTRIIQAGIRNGLSSCRPHSKKSRDARTANTGQMMIARSHGERSKTHFAVMRKGEPMDDLISRKAAAERVLAELPIAQPEIIKCKGCKWKQGSECVRFADIRIHQDDFCSRAERRSQ